MYRQQPEGDERWMRTLSLISLLRGPGGHPESQIHTNETINWRTRVALPLFQAVVLTIAFCLFVGGIILFTGGIDYQLELGWDTGSYIAAWIVALIAAATISRIVYKLLPLADRIVQAVFVVFAMIIIGLGLVSLIFTTQNDGWELFKLTFGAALVLAMLALIYNQARYLVEPYWPRSPFESAMAKSLFPLIAEAMQGDMSELPDVYERDPRYPIVRKNGRVITDEEDDEPVRKRVETIAPEAGNLIWFGLWALGCKSLSINDLSTKPALELPWPENGKTQYLRRKMIRILLARGSTEVSTMVNDERVTGLAENGWWDLRGQGATARWAGSKKRIRRQIEEMWADAMGSAPLPDPHTERQYVYLKE